MTDLTLDQLLADWHLGDDNIGRNATRALDAAGITPAAAAVMPPSELAATPGLGAARLQRPAAQIHAITKALLKERAVDIRAVARWIGELVACRAHEAAAAGAAIEDRFADRIAALDDTRSERR